jgi:acyl transferase domain-containing protein
VGDDSGEICAASIAGVFPLETGLRLVAIHGQIRHRSAEHLVEDLRVQIQQILERQQLQSPSIPLVSLTTGKQLSEQDAVNGAYWVTKGASTNDLDQHWPGEADFKGSICIELGPGRNLKQLALNSSVTLQIFTLLQFQTGGEPIQEQLIKNLGQLWLKGISIDWAGFHAHEERRRVPLPTYPFERQSYWLQPKNMISGSAAVTLKPKEAVQIKGKDLSELTECEKLIVEAWSEVLGFTEFGPDDNFFEIGGDSILLIKLHSLLEVNFPGKITATDLFAYPTITKLTHCLSGKEVPLKGEDLPQTTTTEEKERIHRLLEEGKKGNLSMEEILKKLKTLEE